MKHPAKGKKKAEPWKWTTTSHIKPTDNREWEEQSQDPEGRGDGRSLFPDAVLNKKSGNIHPPRGKGTIIVVDGVTERDFFLFKVVYETAQATPKSSVVHERCECFIDSYSKDAAFAKFRRDGGRGKILSVEMVQSLGRTKCYIQHETPAKSILDKRRPRNVVLDDAGFKARWEIVEEDTEKLAAYYSDKYHVAKDDLLQAAKLRLSMIENGGKLALLKAARAAMKAEGERERNLRRGESRLAEPSEDSSEEF